MLNILTLIILLLNGCTQPVNYLSTINLDVVEGIIDDIENRIEDKCDGEE